jgi:hypothetical protein
MAKPDGLKRWVEAERTRSRLRTLGFAAVYSRARYLGMPEEMLVAVPPSRATLPAAKAVVEQLVEELQAKWARRS